MDPKNPKSISVEMSPNELVVDANQARNYVATKLLHALAPSGLQIHLVLPPSYRDLWRELVAAEEMIKGMSENEVDTRRRGIVEEALESWNKMKRLNPASKKDDETAQESGDETVSAPGHRQEPADVKYFGNLACKFRDTVIVLPEYQQMLEKRKELPVYAYKGISCHLAQL